MKKGNKFIPDRWGKWSNGDEEDNFNGMIDVAVRAIDDVSTQDVVYIRLAIHPVNDPPVILPTSEPAILRTIPSPSAILAASKLADIVMMSICSLRCIIPESMFHSTLHLLSYHTPSDTIYFAISLNLEG